MLSRQLNFIIFWKKINSRKPTTFALGVGKDLIEFSFRGTLKDRPFQISYESFFKNIKKKEKYIDVIWVRELII